MLKKDELKILKLLFTDLTRNLTIMDISKELGQKYVQTYRTIKNLANNNDVQIDPVGNCKVVNLNLSKYNSNYVVAEIERQKEICKNKNINLIHKQILEINKNFVCILFGSQIKKALSNSDVDLLFVIPNEYSQNLFEKKVKQQLAPYNCDITIINEESLFNMWARPKRLNVGNEILKKHAVLYGSEHFINLLKKHYQG
jgi:hypothetical protein